jgi:hypothetical protein
VKNPVLPHGASSKEKAVLAIHHRSSERGILAFSRINTKTVIRRPDNGFCEDLMCDYVITRPGPLRSPTLRRSNRDSNRERRSPVALGMTIMLLNTSIISWDIFGKS